MTVHMYLITVSVMPLREISSNDCVNDFTNDYSTANITFRYDYLG